VHYAIWQRRRFEGGSFGPELAYWKRQLEPLPAMVELPADRPRPAMLSHRGTTQPFKLSQKLNEGITALSRREGVTLYMALLAAFQILLRRYTGMTDIVVGSNCAGRDQVETEKLIGFFVNTLVLRTDLSGNPSFREMLARARDVALAAYAHQDLPFEKLVEELRPQRNLSHHPMFQVAFVMHHSAQEVVLPGLTLTPLELDNGTSKFDLTLAIKSAPDNENLFGFIEYSTDLFEQSTILRMIGHFENVISAMIANIDERIDAFTLLNKAEAHQLLVEWNQTALRFVHDKPVHEFFEDQVEKAPEAVAIVFEDEGITYRELNWRANQLAHYLQERGVVPGALVGISLERSPEMLIAMLGILKAGCAYLPLDPSYPKDRLNLVLQDAKPALLLTRQEDWPAINQSRSENPAVRVHENDLAYVLYTSGSTGKPKGVQIPHRALSNHMQWMQAEFPLNADDRVVQRTSSGFDASVWEFFAPLLAGACLVIPPPAEQWDAAELVRVIQLRKVTVLQVVPSLLRILLDETGLQNCPTLRRVFSGGEPLTAGLRDRFLATHPAELCNLYGPTEACIDTTFFRCATGAGNGESVPIGRPIANTQLYVLDRLQLPVPIGVPGELHIGGNGLARGYLNRSDLTAEVFVPNPFSTKPGERLYRTGDLVRYRADGNLEFLGRIDRQVKLRGFRLELGEIEAILQNDPAVQQALVMLREDGTEDQRLVAYIVCKQGHTSSADQLKSLLLTRLPYYMIPSAFVFLEAFPLTPNGKVDRSALPAAIPDLTGSDAGYVAPRTSVEQVLAMIWEEVLKLNRIGVADNFFDAGGHSLLATQVTSRIRNILRIDLPVRKLFEAPTVERLSHAILADEKKPGQVEKIARIALKVAAMSDEEAGKILEEKKRHHHE
jgi:amino acid adenylation domain-containing protein